MLYRPYQALVVGAFVLGVAGCGGSERKPESGAWESAPGSGRDGDDGGDYYTPIGFNWVGVRHDLAINPKRPRTQNCACLSVEVGKPGESKFTWRGARPEVDSSNLAVAISAIGIDCPGGAANPGDRRPSISAVQRKGKDVFVEIEEITTDRPVASGAIIAPPEPGGGNVYVRARSKTVPYAQPDKGKLCRVF